MSLGIFFSFAVTEGYHFWNSALLLLWQGDELTADP